MRDARLVGLSGDGRWLIIETAGEHVRVPVDDTLRAAVRHEVQLPMPLQTSISPREVQSRIRTGETAAHIAETSGVAVELIARFEGPVLDERRWQAERARRTVVDGTSLEERFAAAVDEDTDASPPIAWDAWIDRDDGAWRVRAICADGRSAVWSWNAQTTRLRGHDDLARLSLSGRVAGDDLEAVLRPLAADREMRAVREPPAAGDQRATATPSDPAATSPASPGPRRRTPVPSWDEIMLGSTSRPRPEEPES